MAKMADVSHSFLLIKCFGACEHTAYISLLCVDVNHLALSVYIQNDFNQTDKTFVNVNVDVVKGLQFWLQIYYVLKKYYI